MEHFNFRTLALCALYECVVVSVTHLLGFVVVVVVVVVLGGSCQQ